MNLTAEQLDQYQQHALTTAVFPLERAVDYCTLGLSGEIGEYIEVSILKAHDLGACISELGDCWWYAAGLADAMGWRLPEVATGPRFIRSYSSIANLGIVIAKLDGAVKKAIRDDHGVLTPERAETIQKALGLAIQTFEDEALDMGTTSWAVMQKNLNKLEARKRAGTIKGDGDVR